MGYDKQRFQYEINEGLICAICTGVLEDPVITAGCAHVFCRACISDWLSRKQQCPIDNSALKLQGLRPVPSIINSVLAQLLISCDYASNGCPMLIKLDCLDAHTKACEFNPSALVPCAKNCGMQILRGTDDDHNCMYELRKCLESLKLQYQETQENIIKLAEENTRSILELKRELSQLKQTSELNTKAILDEMKTQNQELHSAIEKTKDAAALVPQPMEPQYQPMSLTGKWWKQFKVFSCYLSKYAQPSQASVPAPAYFLQKYKGLVLDQDKFVLCRCFGQKLHTCGIEKLENCMLNFRYDFVVENERRINLYLILKLENSHISNDLIPKCGYAFISDHATKL